MASSPRPTTPSSQKKRPGRRQLHRSSGVYNILPQSPKVHYPVDPDNLPLEAAANTEKFEHLSDAMEELDVNMTNLQLIHEAISDGFNESFASFLYGLSITMWCVDFPGCPSRDQWEKLKMVEELDGRILELNEKLRLQRDENERLKGRLTSNEDEAENDDDNRRPDNRKPLTQHRPPKTQRLADPELDDTYMTNEGSFVVNPSASTATRIPQPVKSAPRRLAKRPSPSADVSVYSSSRGPNLNQPPRYMRGLFESTNRPATTSTYRTRKPVNNNRIQKNASRPPFR